MQRNAVDLHSYYVCARHSIHSHTQIHAHPFHTTNYLFVTKHWPHMNIDWQ